LLIPFPIAFLLTTLVCDLLYWFTKSNFVAEVALYCLAAGILTAGVAAVAGFTDFFGNRDVRSMNSAWQHMIGNLAAVLLALVSLWIRFRYGAVDAILPWGLMLTAAVAILLGYTGWKGGHLVYKRRVGMQPEAPPNSLT
jgi:uncharacterized membrane protein